MNRFKSTQKQIVGGKDWRVKSYLSELERDYLPVTVSRSPFFFKTEIIPLTFHRTNHGGSQWLPTKAFGSQQKNGRQKDVVERVKHLIIDWTSGTFSWIM